MRLSFLFIFLFQGSVSIAAALPEPENKIKIFDNDVPYGFTRVFEEVNALHEIRGRLIKCPDKPFMLLYAIIPEFNPPQTRFMGVCRPSEASSLATCWGDSAQESLRCFNWVIDYLELPYNKVVLDDSDQVDHPTDSDDVPFFFGDPNS